jgi:hypothetical protein
VNQNKSQALGILNPRRRKHSNNYRHLKLKQYNY